jgi:hypothetical protein
MKTKPSKPTENVTPAPVGSGDLLGSVSVFGDDVYTPTWCAKDCIEWYKPTGVVLDPCKGHGAFSDLMPGCEWDEIKEGRDFFARTQRVDWIIGNPPYSNFRKWFRHGFELSDNAVWLIPVWKAFSAYGLKIELANWGGGLAHIRYYGTGGKLGWPLGNAIGAVHFKRGHTGPITESYFCIPNAVMCREGRAAGQHTPET